MLVQSAWKYEALRDMQSMLFTFRSPLCVAEQLHRWFELWLLPQCDDLFLVSLFHQPSVRHSNDTNKASLRVQRQNPYLSANNHVVPGLHVLAVFDFRHAPNRLPHLDHKLKHHDLRLHRLREEFRNEEGKTKRWRNFHRRVQEVEARGSA